MKTTEELTRVAADLLNAAELDCPDDAEHILRPSWDEAYRDHWTFHVPDALRCLWPRLSIETKLAAYLMAVQVADGVSRAMDFFD